MPPPGSGNARGEGQDASGGHVVEHIRKTWYEETTEVFRGGLRGFAWMLALMVLLFS
jgi:hypothetical protein